LHGNTRSKYRLLLIAPSYPPYNKGGGGIFYQNIASRLAKRGHEVTLVVGYPGPRVRSEIHNENMNIIWVPLTSFLKTKYPSLQEYAPASPLNLVKLRRLLKSDYDIIHFLAFGHILIDCINIMVKSDRKVLTIHGLPHPVKSHGLSSFLLGGLYQLYRKSLGSYTLKSCIRITVPSNFVAADCTKEGIRQSQLKVIPNGIDNGEYNPIQCDAFEREYNIDSEDIVILSIARVAWMKGLQYGIESMVEVEKRVSRSVKYIIAGPVDSPDYFNDLKSLVKRLNLENKIIFAGHFNLAKKIEALSRADLFLIPSVHETFGLAALEAMAMGKPIVASNIEGLKELIDDNKTGLLVDPANTHMISNAILKLLNDESLRRAISANAKIESKKYEWDQVVNQIESVYDCVMR
jgi:L-malate glycosyltransferase